MGNVHENNFARITEHADAFGGTPSNEVVIQLAVPVNNTEAVAGQDILADHRFQKFTLSFAGATDDVHVGIGPQLGRELYRLPFGIKTKGDRFWLSHFVYFFPFLGVLIFLRELLLAAIRVSPV